MKIRNKGSKIINIGTTILMPDASMDINEATLKLPAIQAFIAKGLTKITGGVTFVNSVASTVCVVLLYLALRPALERANLLPKAEKKAENK